MRLIAQSTTTQEVAGSNPAIPTNAHTGKYIKEANAMSKEPIYRIKVEVIGTENEDRKIDESLRGGGRL